MAAQDRAQDHASSDAEEFPPQPPRFFETFRMEWFDPQTALRQQICRLRHRQPGLCGDWSSAIVFEECDANPAKLFFGDLKQRHRSGRRIAVIRSGHGFEKKFQVRYST